MERDRRLEAGTEPGELDLALPSGYADPSTSLPPPPAATPAPGLYHLTVGAGSFRSNPIPLVIAPRVDGVVDPPVLTPDAAGLYAVTGAGFLPSPATTLKFGSVSLNYSSAATPERRRIHRNATGDRRRLRTAELRARRLSSAVRGQRFRRQHRLGRGDELNRARLDVAASSASKPSLTAQRLLAVTRLRAERLARWMEHHVADGADQP